MQHLSMQSYAPISGLLFERPGFYSPGKELCARKDSAEESGGAK